jgi:hypothetical protein
MEGHIVWIADAIQSMCKTDVLNKAKAAYNIDLTISKMRQLGGQHTYKFIGNNHCRSID